MKTYTISVRKNQKKTIVIEKSGTYIVNLTGEGAEARIMGGLEVHEKETLTVRTIQHHKAPKTKSDLLLKTAVYENGKVDYQGVIKIEKIAQQSNAYQRHENLLLAQNAQVSSKPELEIQADDVRCTHGVTMGMIDEEQLFYLQSRGLSKYSAEDLIVQGFLNIKDHNV